MIAAVNFFDNQANAEYGVTGDVWKYGLDDVLLNKIADEVLSEDYYCATISDSAGEVVCDIYNDGANQVIISLANSNFEMLYKI